MKKRLVWICWKDIRHPEAGGAEVVNQELSRRLVQAGWDVVQLAPGFKGCTAEDRVDGVHIIRVGHSILSFYRLPFYFWRRLRRQTDFLVDTFVCAGSFACLTMPPKQTALILYHIEHIKWFFQASFYGVPRWLMPLLNLFGFFVEKIQLFLLALLFRGPVLTISESTAHELAQLGFRRPRIQILTMGSTARPLAVLTDSRPKEAIFTVLMIGPRSAKRPRHTLQAFEFFQQRHPEAQFWVAGWGGDELMLRRLVEQNSIRNVTFWGRVSDEKRSELLQRAHVLCTSPLREGWGLVVTEANAMGTPVIGYDVPGLRDALAFQNGWLCAPTPRHMADKLEEVFKLWSLNPAAYEQLRQQSLASTKNLSFDRTYEQFVKLLPAVK